MQAQVFHHGVSPSNSTHLGEDRSILNKFKRFPSLVRKLSAASALNGQANAQKNPGEKDVALQSDTNEKRSGNVRESESRFGKEDETIPVNEEEEEPEDELAHVSLIAGLAENNSETRL